MIVGDVLRRWVSAEDVVLDIGSGDGEFLNHVEAEMKIGIDLNPDADSDLKPELEFHAGAVRDLSLFDNASVNVIFTSNFMERRRQTAGLLPFHGIRQWRASNVS